MAASTHTLAPLNLDSVEALAKAYADDNKAERHIIGRRVVIVHALLETHGMKGKDVAAKLHITPGAVSQQKTAYTLASLINVPVRESQAELLATINNVCTGNGINKDARDAGFKSLALELDGKRATVAQVTKLVADIRAFKPTKVGRAPRANEGDATPKTATPAGAHDGVEATRAIPTIHNLITDLDSLLSRITDSAALATELERVQAMIDRHDTALTATIIEGETKRAARNAKIAA